MHIFFSNREHRAFERMMQEKPGDDHYDSGVDGKYPECGPSALPQRSLLPPRLLPLCSRAQHDQNR